MVHIGSDGDPFASHVYRHFMEHTPRKDNISYSILTNGLMLRDFHHRVPHVINNLDKLAISIDGATKQTYEKLRLGGNWDKVIDALECARDLKDQNKFELELHMVVQEDNWREMSLMADLAGRYSVDRLFLNRIEDWSTDLDHSKQKFISTPEFHDQLAIVVKNPIVHAWTLS